LIRRRCCCCSAFYGCVVVLVVVVDDCITLSIQTKTNLVDGAAVAPADEGVDSVVQLTMEKFKCGLVAISNRAGNIFQKISNENDARWPFMHWPVSQVAPRGGTHCTSPRA
jgi:hypothetical protein